MRYIGVLGAVGETMALVGLGLLLFVVRKWAMKPNAAVTAHSGPAGAAPNEAMERARAQAARETED